MEQKVIQLANLDFESKRKNSNNLRVYWPKGIAAAIHTGGMEDAAVICDMQNLNGHPETYSGGSDIRPSRQPHERKSILPERDIPDPPHPDRGVSEVLLLIIE